MRTTSSSSAPGWPGCARRRLLCRRGLDVVVLDAADRPGGRVATDVVDGFRCDRGFQVLNTSYPALRAAADLDALDLRAFTPAAAVRGADGLHTYGDPRRLPGAGASDDRRPARAAARQGDAGGLDGPGPGRAVRAGSRRTAAGRRPSTSPRPASADRCSTGCCGRSCPGSSARRSSRRPRRSCGWSGGRSPSARSRCRPPAWARCRRSWPPGCRTACCGWAAGWTPSAAGPCGWTATSSPSRAVVVATDPVTAAELLPGVAAPRMYALTTLYHVAPAPPAALTDAAPRRHGRPAGQHGRADRGRAGLLPRRPRALVSSSFLGDGRPAPRAGGPPRAGPDLRRSPTDGWVHLHTAEVPGALPALPAGEPAAPRRRARRRPVRGRRPPRHPVAARAPWSAAAARPRPSSPTSAPDGGRRCARTQSHVQSRTCADA